MTSANQPPHLIPSLYLAGYLDQFEDLVRSYGARPRSLRMGELFTQRGVINNTAYFITSGIMQLLLGHDQGEKALSLFGPGTIFPIGVEEHKFLIEYEMILEGFSDVEALALPYPTLKRIVQEHGDFAGELMRENCDFIGYTFFDTINQTFEPCLARICDILYLYHTKVSPAGPDVPMTQAELARVAGASRAQMERSIRLLRETGAIETSRGHVRIASMDALLENCTLSIRTSAGR